MNKKKWKAIVSYCKGRELKGLFKIDYDVACHLNKGDVIILSENNDQLIVKVVSRLFSFEDNSMTLHCIDKDEDKAFLL